MISRAHALLLLLLAAPLSSAGTDPWRLAAEALDRGDNLGAAAALEGKVGAEAALWRARALFLAGQKVRAAGILDKSEQAATHPLGRLTLAQIESETGHQAEALEPLKALARDRRWSAVAWFLQGEAFRALVRAGEAEEAYRRALREDPFFAEARRPLAWIAEGKGNVEGAWRQWDRLAAASPRDGGSRREKERLSARLSRPESEIVPVQRLSSFKGAPCAPEAWTGRVLRVGLGGDSGGRAGRWKEVSLRASRPFRVNEGREHPAGAWTVKVSTGAARLVGADGKTALLLAGESVFRLDDPAAGTWIVDGLPFGAGVAWAGRADREVRGDLILRHAPGEAGVRVILSVPLEPYLYGVVGAEMPVSWPEEALKAQAVIARTYALARRASKPHAKGGYDLCDEQHCQVYAGVAAEADAARMAVDGTRGRTLRHDGSLIHAAFASNCGGWTRSAEGAGWGRSPALRAAAESPDLPVPVDAGTLRRALLAMPSIPCGPSGRVPPCKTRWTRVLDGERTSARMGIGALKVVRVAGRDDSGRVTAVEAVGERAVKTLSSETELRRFIGDGPLRSALYVLENEVRDGKLVRLWVHGGGWGHGVGMCQSGAAGRAEAGSTFETILSHYYPGAVLSSGESEGG